jgi:signal peptidase
MMHSLEDLQNMVLTQPETDGALVDEFGIPWDLQFSSQDGDKGKTDIKLRAHRVFSVILLVALALCALFIAKMRFGVNWYNVSSESMQSVIPEGSLIFVKKVNVNELKKGDIITFGHGDGETVTHQIEEIIEDYTNDGSRAFRTKGTENAEADPELVMAKDIIGVVIKHFPNVGKILAVSGKTIPTVAVVAFVLLALFNRLRYYRPDFTFKKVLTTKMKIKKLKREDVTI